jgi:hypothetical protein
MFFPVIFFVTARTLSLCEPLIHSTLILAYFLYATNIFRTAMPRSTVSTPALISTYSTSMEKFHPSPALNPLMMPLGTEMIFSEGFGNILVTTKSFSAGEVVFSEIPVLTYNPKDLMYSNFRKLLTPQQARAKRSDVVNHPRTEEWSMHMLAFAMAATDVQNTILNSFYTPNRNPGTADVHTGTDKSSHKSLPDTITNSPNSAPNAGDEASSELLDASLRCAHWLQSLATSYMALAAVPELSELLVWPAESLADAALAFVFSAHRFRGQQPDSRTRMHVQRTVHTSVTHHVKLSPLLLHARS